MLSGDTQPPSWAGGCGQPGGVHRTPVGLSKACGQVPQQLSTGWHVPAPSLAKWIATTMVSSSPMMSSRVSSSASTGGDLRQKVSQSHRLIAMWTRSAGTYPTTKPMAFVAPLLSQEASLALRALVDDAGARDAARKMRQSRRRVPLAPGCLATRVVAKATPTVRNEGVSTPRARAGDRSAAIVTQRGVRHSRSLCAGAGPACA